MENGTSQEMLIFLLRNGTAVLIIGRSREGRDDRKDFITMCGICRRETKTRAATYPASIGIIREVLVDSG